jgi:hypothetical protein
LVELDKAMFSINLGQLTMERELIVADIEDDALLGLDILMKGPGVPADIKLTKGAVSANVLDFFSCGCMSLGICLKAFVIITVLAAPVSAVNIILLSCTAPSI